MFQLLDVTWMLAPVSALTSLVLWLWPPVASSFALILGAAESGKVVCSSTVATVFAIQAGQDSRPPGCGYVPPQCPHVVFRLFGVLVVLGGLEVNRLTSDAEVEVFSIPVA